MSRVLHSTMRLWEGPRNGAVSYFLGLGGRTGAVSTMAAEQSSYTSVSTRSRSILRTLPSTATRLVMQRAKLSGNQPVSPSRSRSPCSQPGSRGVDERDPSHPTSALEGSRAWVTMGTDHPSCLEREPRRRRSRPHGLLAPHSTSMTWALWKPRPGPPGADTRPHFGPMTPVLAVLPLRRLSVVCLCACMDPHTPMCLEAQRQP